MAVITYKTSSCSYFDFYKAKEVICRLSLEWSKRKDL